MKDGASLFLWSHPWKKKRQQGADHSGAESRSQWGWEQTPSLSPLTAWVENLPCELPPLPVG